MDMYAQLVPNAAAGFRRAWEIVTLLSVDSRFVRRFRGSESTAIASRPAAPGDEICVIITNFLSACV
jgi:hypothetical protein